MPIEGFSDGLSKAWGAVSEGASKSAGVVKKGAGSLREAANAKGKAVMDFVKDSSAFKEASTAINNAKEGLVYKKLDHIGKEAKKLPGKAKNSAKSTAKSAMKAFKSFVDKQIFKYEQREFNEAFKDIHKRDYLGKKDEKVE